MKDTVDGSKHLGDFCIGDPELAHQLLKGGGPQLVLLDLPLQAAGL